jgi:hypothetical protein
MALIMAKFWNQLTCPSMNEWIKKVCYMPTIQFYSDMKKNENMSFAVKWIELKIIMLSEISQSHKDT